MKKTVRNLFAAFAAAALIGSLASCAASDEENPFVAASTNGSEIGKPSGGNSGAGDENEQILMDSPVDLDWNMSNTASVAKEKVTGASDSSKIKIYYTANEDTDYTAFKLMGGEGAENELYAGTPEGFTIDTTSTSADDLHGCKFTAAPADAVASISYAPSAEEWTKIKANGFAIIGYGAKITKISLTGSSSLPSADDSNSSLVEDNTEGGNESVVELFSGSQKIDWGENGLVIDHEKFTGDFNALRITYNASAGALKLAVCDPWTDVIATGISSGSIGGDGALNLPVGDAQTVTVNLNDSSVAGIKGSGIDGAWGGLKLYGDDTITITKVEAIKAE